jgi:hypothetical protein
MLSLGADEDTFFRPAQIRKTAEAYNADYINMKNTSHAMMLDSHWQESADAINTWLKKSRYNTELNSMRDNKKAESISLFIAF